MIDKTEKMISSEKILNAKIIDVRRDIVLSPKGECFREIVEHPGGVAILAYTDPNHIILIKQFRYATQEELIELPAGKLEKGEKPIDCAKRELLEETGFEAKNFEYLGFIFSSPGFCDEKIHLFKATDLTQKETNFDEFEVIENLITSTEDAIKMVTERKITDSKTVFGIFHVLESMR